MYKRQVHQTGTGLTAFASHSHYEQPVGCLICDSDRRLLLSIWPKGGMEVAVDGRQRQLQSRQLLCGTLGAGPWHTQMNGDMPHVGLLVSPALLRQIAGEDGDALAADLERGLGLWLAPSDPRLLHAAQELDSALMGGASSPLLREAKSLEFLIQVLRVRGTIRSDGATAPPAVVRRADHERLNRARDLLLADLAQPPSIADLARQCGMNTFKLKQAFKQYFGLPVHTLYQRERDVYKRQVINIDRAAAQRLGVDMRTIASVLSNSFSQRQVATLYDPMNQYRVVLELDPRYTCLLYTSRCV